jgi:hypothetical protein
LRSLRAFVECHKIGRCNSFQVCFHTPDQAIRRVGLLKLLGRADKLR